MSDYEVKILFESKVQVTLNMTELSWQFFKGNLAAVPNVESVEIRDVGSKVWSVLTKEDWGKSYA